MLLPGPAFSRRLLRWYDRARRDLPWRLPAGALGTLDPYHVLLSETMLQQTQVATVIPYFHRFLERFPTVESLASAPQQDVLRLWQGLGYYSRARNLHAAAKMIAGELNGLTPATVDGLLKLPGVGRYTAGAIASIAFDRRAPILDGNVQRVLCRLDAVEADPRNPQIKEYLWKRAEEILPKKRVGDFNSALMELGAMICTPRNPQCLLCLVREHCQAFAGQLQDKIPAVKKSPPTPLLHRHTYCIHYNKRWLIEQRPASGRWAGMWQFLTLNVASPEAKQQNMLPIKTTSPKPLMTLSHTLTHRRYRFDVFICDAANTHMPENGNLQKWITLDGLEQYPLPRPHVKIAEMLRQREKTCA